MHTSRAWETQLKRCVLKTVSSPTFLRIYNYHCAAAVTASVTAFVAEPQDLQHEIANLGKQKDSRQTAAAAKLKAAKGAVEAGRAVLKAAQMAHSAALAESEAAAGERKALAQQLSAAEAAVTGALSTRLQVVPLISDRTIGGCSRKGVAQQLTAAEAAFAGVRPVCRVNQEQTPPRSNSAFKHVIHFFES